MSLAHAILGLLTVQPMTGYDLKHLAFDNTIAHFWQADQAQIYRTLDRMTAEGWVECEVEVQTERPNRKVYHLTAAGRDELKRWLQQEQPLPANREAFLVQMFFANEIADDEILRQIDVQIAGHQARLQQLEALSVPPLESGEITRQQMFWRLTLELGFAVEHTYLRWLERCRAVISDQSSSSA